MKKILFASLLTLGSSLAANAQEANATINNPTPLSISVQFWGNAAFSCTPSSMSTYYPTTSGSPYVANTLTYPSTPTANYFNGIRLTYFPSSGPSSYVDFYTCGTPGGVYPLTFPGGPSINLTFVDHPELSTYAFDIVED